MFKINGTNLNLIEAVTFIIIVYWSEMLVFVVNLIGFESAPFANKDPIFFNFLEFLRIVDKNRSSYELMPLLRQVQ